MSDNMDLEKTTIEKAMEFAAIAEDAYREHGVDYGGMLYTFNDRRYGWALPEDLFQNEEFRDRIRNKYPIMHGSDGSVIEHPNGELTGPVTLISPYADNYQHSIVHELAQQEWRKKFTFSHKPKNGKVSLPKKICLTIGDGISEHMCYEEMGHLMDEPSAQIRERNWARYEDLLNGKDEFGDTGFDAWSQRLTENIHLLGPHYQRGVGLNFVLINFPIGMKLADFLEVIAKHPPKEEHILKPMKYRKEVGIA
jgi:hypothetical protein